MRIARVRADDPRLAALDLSLFGEGYEPHWRGQWWLALGPAGQAVGYAGATYWSPDRYVYLARCGVLPSARGQGLQRRFIRVREAWARAQGAEGCYTYTSPTNLHSANNLIRAGYELWRPARPWGMAGALYWQRALEARR